jgi:Virulence activator alpha C-term
LTTAGYDAIRDFTCQSPKPTAIRDDLLVMVQALDAGDATAVRNAVANQVQRATDKLALLERIRTRMLGSESEDHHLATTNAVGPYLTLLRGIAFEQDNIRWAEHALSIIDRRFPGSGVDS